MAYEMKPGQGSAFKNDKKVEEWHADYRGKVMLPDGQMAWVDLTRKKTGKGDVFVAVKLRLMENQDAVPVAEGRRAAPSAASHAGLDDEVPFAPEF